MIAVSLLLADEDRLRGRLRRLAGRGVHIEVRADRLPSSVDWDALRAAAPDTELIATCMLEEEGGAFAGSRTQRRARLADAAAAGFDWVDVPLDEDPPSLDAEVRRVRSVHATAPGALDVEGALARGLAALDDGDVLKIVDWAEYAEQSFTALALLDHAPAGRLIAFAQGPGGAASRTWSLVRGAPWTYAAWPGEATAPGQQDWRALRHSLPAQPSQATRVCGVMGDPIAHSLSPFLWSEAFRRGEPPADAVYLPLRVGDAAAFLAAAHARGVRALSVTAPHKQAALAAAVEADEAARSCGAANFLIAAEEGWHARNTDGDAALDALASAGWSAEASLLVLGAGGAAEATVRAARRRGARVTVAARRPPQAWSESGGVTVEALEEADPAAHAGVIQATPVGGRAAPGRLLAGRGFRRGSAVLDMVYDPPHTAFLQAAAEDGAVPVPGTEMLLRQMLAPCAAVTGARPEPEALRAALEEHLDRRMAVVLIGMRGAGKSTLGRALAEDTERAFVDADEELAHRHGRRLADWIAEDLAGFRAAESALLPELLARHDTVVALGGGVVEDAGNRARLRAHPRVVLLDCPVEELAARQRAAPRPRLVEGTLEEEVFALASRRAEAYRACADHVVDASGGAEQALARLRACLSDAGAPAR